MLKLGINGAAGRMGRRIAALAIEDPEVDVVAAVENEGNPESGKDIGTVSGSEACGVSIATDIRTALGDADCIIEFTLPEATLKNLDMCVEGGVPVVIGTTGIDADGEAEIKKASQKIPIVFSPNMAMGVNVLFDLVGEASKALSGEFSIKVDETHHIHKKDSPSGTAKEIARVIKTSSGVEAPVEAFREGEVIGNHGIIFESKYETLEIRHNAKSRDVFAAGAIKAAKFLKGQKPGLYTMFDVLGLKK